MAETPAARAAFSRCPDYKSPGLLQHAYMAGLIDGEGYLRRHSSSSGSYLVQVKMCDREVIDWLAKHGGWVEVITKVRGNRQVAYRWTLGRRRCVLAFLEDVIPFMKLKKKRAMAEAMRDEIRRNLGL